MFVRPERLWFIHRSVIGGYMATEFYKDPQAIVDYGFDWEAWLGVGETITNHTVTVSAGITKDSTSIVSETVVVWLSGGTLGSEYTVNCQITTSANRTDQRTATVYVRDR